MTFTLRLRKNRDGGWLCAVENDRGEMVACVYRLSENPKRAYRAGRRMKRRLEQCCG